MLREAKMACPKTHRRVRTHIGVFLFVLVFWGGGGWVFCCYMNIVYLLALAWRIQPPGGLQILPILFMVIDPASRTVLVHSRFLNIYLLA